MRPLPRKWRIWRNVVVDLQTGCWLWTKGLMPNGYALMHCWEKGRRQMAHRYSYETFIGPIPDDLPLDHLCRVRRCVNPDHLEPVTVAENLRRAASVEAASMARSARTHCPKGHPRTAENTGIGKTGKRFCKPCGRAASLAYYHRKVAER